MTDTEKLDALEREVDLLSQSIVEVSDENDEILKTLKDLNLKFRTFFQIYLENCEPEQANKIFKEYQKRTFKKI